MECEMTTRNLKKELCYSSYADYENGRDIENIDFECLIYLLEEILERLEKLEK